MGSRFSSQWSAPSFRDNPTLTKFFLGNQQPFGISSSLLPLRPGTLLFGKYTQGGVSSMTPKQILDSFSETLMRDERILSPQERALIANLLQHAKTAAGTDPETHEAVRAVIAAAIGETVAQRAFSVLGGSIVERIIESSSVATNDSANGRREFMGTPTPPGPEPQHPGVKAPQKQPQPVRRDAPAPSEPQHPGTPLTVPGA